MGLKIDRLELTKNVISEGINGIACFVTAYSFSLLIRHYIMMLIALATHEDETEFSLPFETVQVTLVLILTLIDVYSHIIINIRYQTPPKEAPSAPNAESEIEPLLRNGTELEDDPFSVLSELAAKCEPFERELILNLIKNKYGNDETHAVVQTATTLLNKPSIKLNPCEIAITYICALMCSCEVAGAPAALYYMLVGAGRINPNNPENTYLLAGGTLVASGFALWSIGFKRRLAEAHFKDYNQAHQLAHGPAPKGSTA